MKPNLFKIATKELSQDGFITWLLQWADVEHAQLNKNLNETAKDFVRMLIGETSDYQINKVEAKRQWKNIDIIGKINNEYVIVIEDKTVSGQHSGQLERYKIITNQHYPEHKIVFNYLKTGNESAHTLKDVFDSNYKIIDRRLILDVLNKREVSNEIFIDFKEYLTIIEEETMSYYKLSDITSKERAAQGFYLNLQQLIGKETHWQYVSNPSRGFLGFWYNFTKLDSIGEIYIQIENAFQNGIELVIKIGKYQPRTTATLYKLLSEIKPYAQKNEIMLKKT